MRFLEGFRLIYKLLMKLHDLVRKMEAKSGFYNFDLLAKIFQTIQTILQVPVIIFFLLVKKINTWQIFGCLAEELKFMAT